MRDSTVYGFTGTQRGMTEQQLDGLSWLLSEGDVERFHHGDCIGADSEAHDLVRDLCPDVEIVIHPPFDNRKRAFNHGDKLREAKGYMERNEDIVEEAEILIATPSEFKEKIRSGTWATIRRARKAGKPVIIIFPDGTTNQTKKKDDGQLRLF